MERTTPHHSVPRRTTPHLQPILSNQSPTVTAAAAAAATATHHVPTTHPPTTFPPIALPPPSLPLPEARWARLLFSTDTSIKKDTFTKALQDTSTIVTPAVVAPPEATAQPVEMGATELAEPPSDEAISALWYALAAPGSPVLAKTEVAQRWQVLADGDGAGAVVFQAFNEAVVKGAEVAAESGGDDDGGEVVDYEAVEVEALMAMCAEREMVNLPPMKVMER